MNAIYVMGNMLGDTMYYGAGAGSVPTASAVVADMVFLAKNADKNVPLKWEADKLKLSDAQKQEYRYFVRSAAPEAVVERTFKDVEYVSLDIDEEVGFITPLMPEHEFVEREKALGGGTISVIRLA